ncbi:hypothetical protein BKA08_001586 [Nocardioides marinisabuli]|uniref:Uncharacterized protein n=1 Tax=Nocardioides marinisabuli TaxID=419476 RepID=A0A7Y9F0L9_9ACTN|nr:hypothetical protein [Nocardioides marinisabuli]NYD57348.1 hypothetical protein [Nocardioides marinisabuli]
MTTRAGAPATTAPTGPRRTAARPRRGGEPGRRSLLGASLLVLFGSFMPWVDTPLGTVLGGQGAGLWTFYACMLGLAGVMVPLRGLAVAQAALLGVVALALPLWQVGHLLSLVGTAGWMPGPGLVLVLGGGVLACVSAVRLHRGPREA